MSEPKWNKMSLATVRDVAAELYEAVAAAEFLIEEITDLEGREGVTDYDFAEQVIALAHSKRDEIRAALAKARGE